VSDSTSPCHRIAAAGLAWRVTLCGPRSLVTAAAALRRALGALRLAASCQLFLCLPAVARASVRRPRIRVATLHGHW
jgi:hypothetical protein